MKQTITLAGAIGYIILIGMVRICMAQNSEEDKKGLIIRSDPPGAMLYFEGENSFVGAAPFRLKTNMIGRYRVTAVKSGYEKRRFDYFFKGSETGTMKIRLQPKTGVKAGLRSLVFPGWGQYYSERNTSAIFISMLTAAAGVGTLVADRDYNRVVDAYQLALDNYEKNKKNYELSNQYWQIVADKQKKADAIFQRRQTWLYVTGGLWLYNFLDSIFFFPSFDQELFNKVTPSISTRMQEGALGLSLTWSF
ncbi:MAG: DUF5683 domain-containing protein [candidate division KSB1 bacterium]|nr:DUF5683 domain-containing protein [candidate division KSB1 bacterium]